MEGEHGSGEYYSFLPFPSPSTKTSINSCNAWLALLQGLKKLAFTLKNVNFVLGDRGHRTNREDEYF